MLIVDDRKMIPILNIDVDDDVDDRKIWKGRKRRWKFILRQKTTKTMKMQAIR